MLCKCIKIKYKNAKIPALNEQLLNYKKSAEDTVQQEIYEEILKETNFQMYDEKEADAFQNNMFSISKSKELFIPKCNLQIPQIDENLVKKLIDGEINSDEFKSYSSKLLDKITDFEQKMCEYKRQLKRKLIEYIPHLHEIYVHEVRIGENQFDTFRDYVKNFLEFTLKI